VFALKSRVQTGVRVRHILQGRRRKAKSDVPTYLLFLRVFEILRPAFGKHFCGVFELVMQRSKEKNDRIFFPP
jgi:hypothetical protein